MLFVFWVHWKGRKKKRKETPYFDCFGSVLFPETRDRIQHETQVEQLQQSNPQDAWTGSEVPYLSPFVPWAWRIGVSRKKRRNFLKFSDVSTPILASKSAVFKTFVSYFSKLNFRRHLIEFSNFLKFSPIKLGRRSGSFSIATAPTKEKEKIPKKH